MTKRKPKVTEREVRLARAFMSAMKADEKNGYLLLAVIIWQRAMKKAHDPFWKSLSRLSAMAAGKALAARVKAKAKAHPHDYKALMADFRDRNATSDSQVTAAKLFLKDLGASSYDKSHYGYSAKTAGYYVWDPGNLHLPPEDRAGRYVWVPGKDEKNPMEAAWYSLTGAHIPPAWYNDPIAAVKPVPQHPIPAQPRSLQHVQPKADYIMPYAAQNFYEERPHLGENVLPQD